MEPTLRWRQGQHNISLTVIYDMKRLSTSTHSSWTKLIEEATIDGQEISWLTGKNIIPITLASIAVILSIVALAISITSIVKMKIYASIKFANKTTYGLQNVPPSGLQIDQHSKFEIQFHPKDTGRKTFTYCGQQVTLGKSKNSIKIDGYSLKL